LHNVVTKDFVRCFMDGCFMKKDILISCVCVVKKRLIFLARFLHNI